MTLNDVTKRKANGRLTPFQLRVIEACYKWHVPKAHVAEFIEVSLPAVNYQYMKLEGQQTEQYPAITPEFVVHLEGLV